MRTLEDRENNENENIETTYQKAQQDQSLDEEGDPNQMSETSNMEAKFAQEIKLCSDETKTILGTKLQGEGPLTQQQEKAKVVDINDILDVDSNVINYGQFICGKILGSTLLLSNLSNVDQIVTMNVSKK